MMVLASIMLPGAVTLIPLYIMYNKIGWLDTFYPLTVPAFFGGGAFNIFLLRQFFMTIPLANWKKLRCFRWRKPLSHLVADHDAPLQAGAGHRCGLYLSGVWNDFYGPLIFLTNPDKYTLALGVSFFRELYNTQIPLMMAMSFLMVIPTLAVFFFAQRLMIRGVVMSGLKG
ncbi:MAG: hypothetical protein R2867_41180 [Caldilineaceae bacterium]